MPKCVGVTGTRERDASLSLITGRQPVAATAGVNFTVHLKSPPISLTRTQKPRRRSDTLTALKNRRWKAVMDAVVSFALSVLPASPLIYPLNTGWRSGAAATEPAGNQAVAPQGHVDVCDTRPHEDL